MSVLWPSPVPLDTQGPHSSDLYPTSLPANTEGSRVGNQVESGSRAFHGVVSENAAAISGQMQNSVNWTFYNRILLIPQLVDLGNLLNAQVRTISVWNGFLVGKSLTSFSAVNAGGITVAQPVVPPYTIRPLEMLNYGINVSMDGPVVISADFIWRIEGIDYTAHVAGQRAVMFPFKSNFREDFTENLEWKSDILRSYDGSEQRRAVRTKARRSFEFKFSLMTALDTQIFQNLMFGWQNRVFAVPVWSDKRNLGSDQVIGNTVLSVNPTGYSFTEGDMAVLYNSPIDYEVVVISIVGTSTITANNGLQRNWPKNTAVFPVVLGHLSDSVSTQRLTDTVIEGSALFQTSPDVTDPYTPDGSALATYDGKEVITVQPNWASALDHSYDFTFDTVDQQSGPIQWFVTELTGRTGRRYSWLFSDRATVLEFRKFLQRRVGMVKPCWVPTWTNDFSALADIQPSDTSITVKENGFRALVGVNTARDRIMLRTKAGTVYYRRITGVSISDSGTDAKLIIDNSFGVLIKTADIQGIHVLQLCRLATDKVSIVWKSDTVATVDTTFTTVPA